MSLILPPGTLNGHYSCKQHLYTVHSGSPQVVLDTPGPSNAPPIDDNIRIPLFRQPRYLSHAFPYLLFIPKHFAWRSPFFKTLDRSRLNLPIIKVEDEGFRLHPDVSAEWLELEICLRALGREMIELMPTLRWLGRIVSPWFFPGRFKFLAAFQTEEKARAGAWYSLDNFLPLLGYVSMGLWCMHSWEHEALGRGEEVPDWRRQVTDKTKIHPAFLDYLEDSINWHEERVGAFYRVQSHADLTYELREQCTEIEWLLSSILRSTCPIPIYLSWGSLPKEISMFDVPAAFHDFVPDQQELESLNSPDGKVKFSRWTVNNESFVWERNPYTPPFVPVAAATPPHNETSASTILPASPFPPLPKFSKQKPNETIQAFFRRRREANLKRIAKENSVDRQRRIQRADNAKRGAIPKKAHVFVWEKQDGHYIRQPVTRGEFEDYWSEYPGPERRFDSIANEWDLCQLFRENDPVFGDGFDDALSDDDDDVGMDPTFPQDIDMASRLPREDKEVMQHPHDVENALNEDVFECDDLGPDLTESDIPKHSLAATSRKYVNVLFLRFGVAPRTEKPVYESTAENLLDTLGKRFGFVMPSSPERFVARSPPQERLDIQHLPNIIGMTDIASELASQKDLKNVLSTFFGQCREARSVNHIDKALLDYHQPHLFVRPPSPFKIGREYLKSMRNPAERKWYYVLRRIGSGIGSEVLLIPQATDLLEVLRQQWGPDIRDVVRHLLARGIPFWLAYISLEIMPASERVVPGIRPKGFKPDTTSGLGFRPHGYQFDGDDYNAYTNQRDYKLLHTPRGRIALQYGGVVARLARSEVSDDDFFRGFDDDIYTTGDCLWDETSPHAYWHDRLSDREIDLLCGVYHVGTGQKKLTGKGKGKETQGRRQPDASQQTDAEADDQTSIVSWWPKPNAWARGSLHGAWWTPQCENDFFLKRLGHFAKGVYIPQRPSNWRHNLKFRKEVKNCWEGFERVADSMVEGIVAVLAQHPS